MNSAAPHPTLRDDWQERRAFLARADRDSEWVDTQLRVLDFLLKRYGDSPEAGRPAQFPRPSAIYINQRAVLVHHHLGKHLASGVKSPREAQERMATILERMAQPPPKRPLPWLDDETPDEEQVSAEQAGVHRADAPQADAQQPEAEIETSVVAPYVGEPREVRDARRLRFLLADPSPEVRMRAIFELGETGDLDDVGLLMDLLALDEADEGPGERRMLSEAIEKISGTRPRGELAEGLPSLNPLLRARQCAAAADGSGLHGLLFGTSLVMGLGMVITVIAILYARGRTPGAFYGTAVLIAVYGLGAALACYLERTKRRRGW